MTIFKSLAADFTTPIPDDLTIPQFILDTHHPLRPVRTTGNPWFIEDETGRAITYEEVKSRTYGLANAIAGRWGLGDNDVVCIFSPNHVDYPISVWASHRLGAAVSAANPSYTAAELVHQLRTSKATLLIAHKASLAVAEDAARQSGLSSDRIVVLGGTAGQTPNVEQLIAEGLACPPQFTERKLKPGENKTKVAFLSFSSGTTGSPKAVAIPHHSLIANVLQFASYNGSTDTKVPWANRRFRPGDVSCGVLPMFHIYGLIVNLHDTLFIGHTLVVTSKFSFPEFLKSIVRYKITHLWIVPPMVVLFCKHPAVKLVDLSSIRFVMVGAAPLSAELTAQFCKLLPNADIGQGYGMTETATVVTMQPLSQKIGTPGSAGQLVTGTIAKVYKVDGTLADYDEPGELVVKGPQMALRYTNNEQATKETFQDGWVRTGDEVLFRKNGDMFIVDRLKEILKVKGFQVAPAELEGHLLDHPDVADAGVVGISDEFSGEVPLAFIALHQDALARIAQDPAEGDRIKTALQKHVSDAKIRYKWLDGGVEFIDAIPKNPSGKILRRILREKAKVVQANRGGRDTKAKL